MRSSISSRLTARMPRIGGKHNSRQAGASIPANAGRAEMNSRYWFTGIPLADRRRLGLCGIPRRVFAAENSRFPVKFPSERERPTREQFARDWLHRHFLLKNNENFRIFRSRPSICPNSGRRLGDWYVPGPPGQPPSVPSNPAPAISRNRASKTSACRVSHSHIVTTCRPACSRRRLTSSSRATLRSNLACRQLMTSSAAFTCGGRYPPG